MYPDFRLTETIAYQEAPVRSEDKILDNKPFHPFQSTDNVNMEGLFQFLNPVKGTI